MKRLLGARSLCLDVYADDSDGKKYDIEVQRADTGASEKRARYHSSAIDSDVLDAKEDFEDLPESYVIFITENDFSCSNPDEMIDKEMAEISRYYKETKEGQDIMCKVMEDYANEVRQEMIIQNIKKSWKNSNILQNRRWISWIFHLQNSLNIRQNYRAYIGKETIVSTSMLW